MSKDCGENDDDKQEREYEDFMAHRYNRDYHEPPIMQEHSRTFVKYLAQVVRPNDRILDLGCASASLWPLFKEILDPSVSLVGVDLSPKMITEAQQLFPDGDFRVGSMTQVPAAAGEFDIVIVSSAFHHISDDMLPEALNEISRVLDEHGALIGREPLVSDRLGDRGGWIGGALMHLRHLAYRLTHTREYPEPDPGPHHHAYEVRHFLGMISDKFTVTNIKFKNPISFFLARSRHPIVEKIAIMLDELIDHKEGQELLYLARKNYIDAGEVSHCIEKEIKNNYVEDIPKLLAYIAEAAIVMEQVLEQDFRNAGTPIEKRVSLTIRDAMRQLIWKMRL